MDNSLFAKVDALAGRLAGLGPLSKETAARLMDAFMIESTVDSIAMERRSLALSGTLQILKEGKPTENKPQQMHQEAVGHRRAFELMLKEAVPGAALTEDIIKRIHSLVLTTDPESRGVYRIYPVSLRSAAHMPPQPRLIPALMETLLADFHSMKRETHIIRALAEFHLRFAGIQPFNDGNSRTNRLVMNLELIKAGLLPINIKSSDREKYYGCYDMYFREGLSSGALAELMAGYEIYELNRHISIRENEINL